MLFALAMYLVQAANASGGQEVIITSAAPDHAAQARRYVDRISEPLAGNLPLARFAGPVCVGSAGLPAGAGQVVVDRVSDIVASVGLRVGETGCAPNLMVVFVGNSRAALRRLARVHSGALTSQSLADIGRIAKEPGHARAWIEVETRGRDGERLSYAPDMAPTLSTTATASRLYATIRRDVASATVLIDRDAVADRDLMQVADYAAMRALTGARLRGQPDGNTILALFTPDGDARAPRTLTSYDRGYLEGLYAGQGNVLPHMKKQSIVAHMVRDGSGTDERAPAP